MSFIAYLPTVFLKADDRVKLSKKDFEKSKKLF